MRHEELKIGKTYETSFGTRLGLLEKTTTVNKTFYNFQFTNPKIGKYAIYTHVQVNLLNLEEVVPCEFCNEIDCQSKCKGLTREQRILFTLMWLSITMFFLKICFIVYNFW